MAGWETLEQKAQKAWAFAHERGRLRALENRRDKEWELIAHLSHSLDDQLFLLDEKATGPHPFNSASIGHRGMNSAAGSGTGRETAEHPAQWNDLWSTLESELTALDLRRQGSSFNAAAQAVPGRSAPALPPSGEKRGGEGEQNALVRTAHYGRSEMAGQRVKEIDFPLNGLHDDISRLAAQLDAMRQEAMRRDAILRADVERSADIGQLRKEVGEITLSLGSFMPVSALRDFDQDVKAVIERFEKLGASGPAEPMLRLQRQLHEINELIAAMANLVSKAIDRLGLRQTGHEAQIESGARSTAEGERVSAEALRTFEDRIETLARRVGAAIAQTEISDQYIALARQIDAVRQQLTARADANAAFSVPHRQQLEQLVHVLAARMASLPNPQPVPDLTTATVSLTPERAVEASRHEPAAPGVVVEQPGYVIDPLDPMASAIHRLSADMEEMKGSLRDIVRDAVHQAADEFRHSMPKGQMSGADLQMAERRFMQIEAMIREGLGALEDRLGKVEARLTHDEGAQATFFGTDGRQNQEVIEERSLRSILTLGETPIFAPVNERGNRLAPSANIETSPRHVPASGGIGRSLERSEDQSWPEKKSPEPSDAESRIDEEELLEPGSGLPFSVRSAGKPAGRQASAAASLQQPLTKPLTAIDGFPGEPSTQKPQFSGIRPVIEVKKSSGVEGQASISRGRIARMLTPFRRLFQKKMLLLGLAGFALLAVLEGGLYAFAGRNPERVAEESAGALAADSDETAVDAVLPPNDGQTHVIASAALQAADEKSDFAQMGEDRLIALSDAGQAPAQYRRALHLQEGAAHEPGDDPARDLRAAVTLYEKAAEQGFAPARYRLAVLYEKGLGVARDLDKAMALYRQAAEQGNTRAMHNLAVLSAETETGPADYATAITWFARAAEYGLRDSQYNCAILLARGLGAPRDLLKAYAWFAIAAAQGDEESARKRDELARRLSDEELITAKTFVAAYKPKTIDNAANDVPPSAIKKDMGARRADKAAPKTVSLCEGGHFLANSRLACFQ